MPRKSDPSCPLCGAPSAPEFKPFCSRGCKDRDLLNWLGDGYRIPGPPADNQGVASEDEGG
ncbi:DNA gyrase inhibitor YacG [Sphingomicrobium nitratireducens]|uniref:DNA gyrase inhibitor YacG n=1 Tax=Sphingomicrobium nitratireducens TaxID=2964666 RepID=UPI0022407A8B|nr:DNA gyrase inhibitor YacG [Sphingomicrobium nitratireducens]